MILRLAATRIELEPTTRSWEEMIMMFFKVPDPLRLDRAVIVWIRSDSGRTWLGLVGILGRVRFQSQASRFVTPMA